MNNLMMLIIAIISIMIIKKIINLLGNKVLKLNPYIQTVIGICIIIVMMIIFNSVKIIDKIKMNILTILIIIITFYLGLIFQKYYFILSDKQTKKINQHQKNKSSN